jgi:hypothetical protein
LKWMVVLYFAFGAALAAEIVILNTAQPFEYSEFRACSVSHWVQSKNGVAANAKCGEEAVLVPSAVTIRHLTNGSGIICRKGHGVYITEAVNWDCQTLLDLDQQRVEDHERSG